jgi:putative ABC transport system permease protein
VDDSSSAVPPARGRFGALLALAGFSTATALEAVAHNKLRAALTSLGILFGVASVIAMLAIRNGAEQEILDQMRLLGTNNVVVTPFVKQEEGEVKASDKKDKNKFSPGLTYADAEALQSIPGVEAMSGEIVLNSVFTREGRRRSGKLVGVDSAYFRMLNLGLASGSWFAPSQIAEGATVAIIGQGVRSRFFTTEDPVGNEIKVGGNWLTVIGVLRDRQVTSEVSDRLGIRDANMDIYVPVTTMLRRYRDRAKVTRRDIEEAARPYVVIATDSSGGEEEERRAEQKNRNQLDRIVLRVNDSKLIGSVANVSQRMLTRRHNTVTDFEVTVPELLLKQEQRTRTIFNVVLGAIASISLIVGGIGIMNIMLASILERIREIGVRRAMGATQQNILAQFLTEAVLISVVGGVAGILVGAGISLIIERTAGIHTLVSPISVIVSFGVSFTVGLVFGIVPAHRAAKQDPITCLRYE